jgi:hypothetical protein
MFIISHPMQVSSDLSPSKTAWTYAADRIENKCFVLTSAVVEIMVKSGRPGTTTNTSPAVVQENRRSQMP